MAEWLRTCDQAESEWHCYNQNIYIKKKLIYNYSHKAYCAGLELCMRYAHALCNSMHALCTCMHLQLRIFPFIWGIGLKICCVSSPSEEILKYR